MKLREKLEKKLCDHGLWPNQAAAVMKQLEEHSAQASMKGRWDDPEEDYPPMMANVLWYAMKAEAISWIEANCPEHFAKEILSARPTDADKIPEG